jgi:ketosteroid isomerase-like protein
MERAEVIDSQVQVSVPADAAIATYILRTTSKSAKGQGATPDDQDADVPFKRNGRWKTVHVHYSPAGPERRPQ